MLTQVSNFILGFVWFGRDKIWNTNHVEPAARENTKLQYNCLCTSHAQSHFIVDFS